MRHMSNNRRGGRGKSNPSRKSVHPRYQNFESNGPDGRLRGTPSQVHEKFVQQARDALVSGDTVRSQNLLQYAEHYFRLGDLGGYSQTDRNSSQPEEGLSAEDQIDGPYQDQNQDMAQPDFRGSEPRGSDSRGSDSRNSESRGQNSRGRNSRGSESRGSDSRGSESRRSEPNRSDAHREDAQRPRRERGARYGRGGRVNSSQPPEHRPEHRQDPRDESQAPAQSAPDTSDHQPGFGSQMPAFLGGGASEAANLGRNAATASSATSEHEQSSTEASRGEIANKGEAASKGETASKETESQKPARRSVRRTPYGPRRRPEPRNTSDDA